MTGRYGTQWRTTPARIAEEHRLHIAQLEADATVAAFRQAAIAAAERKGLALTKRDAT